MNYGNDPADQIVRFTLEGAEVALKLSGLAAKTLPCLFTPYSAIKRKPVVKPAWYEC